MPIVPLEHSGQDFAVDPRAITLFDLQARREGDKVVMGHYLSDPNAPYLLKLFQLGPNYLEAVISSIQDDERAGKGNLTKRVIVDNRTAILLYLQGALTLIDFSDVQHREIDLGKITGNPAVHVPTLLLRPIKWGIYSFPLLIISERWFGNFRATLDENDDVV